LSTLGAIAVGFRAARQSSRTTAASRSGAATAGFRLALAKLIAALGSILGLGAIVAAAWLVAVPLGLLAAGLAFFVLEWRLSEGGRE
jgi:hypothetical protein